MITSMGTQYHWEGKIIQSIYRVHDAGREGGGHHFGTYFIIITSSFWHILIFMDWDSGCNNVPRNSVRAQDQKRDKEKTYGW